VTDAELLEYLHHALHDHAVCFEGWARQTTDPGGKIAYGACAGNLRALLKTVARHRSDAQEVEC
jgi:hypothetical protein